MEIYASIGASIIFLIFFLIGLGVGISNVVARRDNGAGALLYLFAFIGMAVWIYIQFEDLRFSKMVVAVVSVEGSKNK